MKFRLALTLLLVQLSSAAGANLTRGGDGIIVDDENFAYAETQGVFLDMLTKFQRLYPGTSGTGMFAHAQETTNPRGDDIPRPNFDTLYSGALVDLTEPATLTIEKTDRYQSVLVVTEDHYMPTYFIYSNPGSFVMTEENMGSKYVMLLGRTLVNAHDEEDKLDAYALQKALTIEQTNKGEYEPTEEWDEDSLTETRIKYVDLKQKKVVTSGEMFGPNDGTITQENHNIGVANGWGGNPPMMAVYEDYPARSTGPYKLSLKNVPVRAFWSVTVYDVMGFVNPHEEYHVNSHFADVEYDGTIIVNFVDYSDIRNCDDDMSNLLSVYAGWNFVLRLYEPDEKILDGEWERPQLEVVDCPASWDKEKCQSVGCAYEKNKDTGEEQCENRPADSKELCATYLSAETCNNAQYVCQWDPKKGCKQYDCKSQESEEECGGDCEWNNKKGKCKDLKGTMKFKSIPMIVEDE